MTLGKGVNTGKRLAGFIGLAAVVVLVAWWFNRTVDPSPWTEIETEMLRSLWIGSLPPLGPDPSNAMADDPRAAKLGQQ